MKKGIINTTVFVSAFMLTTSCSLFKTKYFSWLVSTKNNSEINYCLLIGQNDHSDSIERTRYTREALGTRDPDTEVNGNANLGKPKQGKLTLCKGTSYEKTFTVNELEHAEQKSLAGVTWDSITANGTTSTWISKHTNNITMFVSNNDSMAEGCLSASNFIHNLPIFGYDANASTIIKIKKGLIMGTVDQNPSAQTSTAYLLIRNILEDEERNANGIGTTTYNPLSRGFNGKDTPTEFGLYINGFAYGDKIPDREGLSNPFEDENNMILDGTGKHEILSKSISVDTFNIDDFIDEDGNVYDAKVLAWNKEKGFVGYIGDAPSKPTRSYRVCHVYNNVAETYIQGNMCSFYNEYAGNDSATFGNALNLDIEKIDGDGVDETLIFNKISSAAKNKPFDAYLINMVTTTDGGTFVSNIARLAAKKEGRDFSVSGWDNFEDRLNTPLIFWNKQPQTIKGEVDVETMNNKYFKYTYYVGVDSPYGGKVQGEMIVKFLESQYKKSIGL